jgi:type IV secretion system protein VirD4
MIISKDIILSEKFCYEHIAAIGPTGSNKTTSLFFTNLLSDELPKNSSIIVTDPKGELFKATAKYQKSLGRTPLVFAPLEPSRSLKYNPLQQCNDVTEVRELAQNLLLNSTLALEITSGVKAGGLEWIEMATPLFVAALLYVKKAGPPINTITNAMEFIINSSDDEIDSILSGADKEVKTQYNIFKACAKSDRTMGSIKITLASKLQLFTDEKIQMTTQYTEFTAEQLREKPYVLYVIYPERKSTYLSPFMAIFFSQFINTLIESYDEKSLSCFLLFDEFANIGQLNSFAQNISTVRSRRMSYLICLQSVTQLIQLYGKDNAMSILNNLKTKVVLPGLSDLETLRYISGLCGWKEIKTVSESKSEKGISHTISTSRKKIMEEDEIRRLDEKKMLIVAHNRLPVISEKDLYFENKKYLKNIM